MILACMQPMRYFPWSRAVFRASSPDTEELKPSDFAPAGGLLNVLSEGLNPEQVGTYFHTFFLFYGNDDLDMTV